MITRAIIEERVREWNLREDVVEKDYVLGWLLWAIATEDALAHTWVFKGGTCLKKCYFETYRFSEDLDFTVIEGGPVRAEDLDRIFLPLLRRLQEASGIQFDGQSPRFKTQENGRYTEGRIYYRGPRQAPQVASVKLDLSSSEVLARPPVFRKIGHAYPDALPEPGHVRCYAFEEVFAEKIRAMGERCRPRDLYDIVQLLRRSDLRRERDLVRDTLHAKCRSKGVAIPTYAALETSEFRQEIERAWKDMLSHQLPSLPPFESYWQDLQPLFDWLEGNAEPVSLAPAPATEATQDDWMPPATVYSWGEGVAIEPIRFAAANHLCVEIGYQGTVREIEPYALRRSRAGNLLLVAVKTATREPRTYRIDRIESARVTQKPFKPVYAVEIGSTGNLHAPEITRLSTSRSPSFHRSEGPIYVVTCPICEREFRRKSNDTTLRPHKDSSGWDCAGRRGYLARIE